MKTKSLKETEQLKEEILSNFFLMTIVEDLKGEKVILVKKKLPKEYLMLNGLEIKNESLWIFPCDFPKRGENREEASERIGYEQSGYKVKFIEPIKDSLVSIRLESLSEFYHSITVCKIIEDQIDSQWKKPENIDEIIWVKKIKIHHYIPDEIRKKWNTHIKFRIGNFK
jgi:hypothetical protein